MKSILAVIGVLTVLLFLDFHGAQPFEPDETRYSEIPHAMVASGDYLSLKMNGSHYFEKPPMLYWLNAASIKTFGETLFAVRLPVRLAAMGTVLLILLCGGTEGPVSALFYLGSLLPFALGRINLTDGIVSFFLTASFFAMRALLRAREQGRRSILAEFSLGAAMAGAFLSKGLIALVLPALVLLPWAAILGRWRRVGDVLVSWVPFVFLIIVGPALWILERSNPGFTHFFIIREHFQRYSSGIHERTQPFVFFIPVFLLGMLPWTLFFFRAVRPLVTLNRQALAKDPDLLYFGLWTAAPLLFFSFSNSKLIPYILPVFPAAAWLLGRWWMTQKKDGEAVWRWQAVLMSMLATAVFLIAQRASVVVHLALLPYAVVAAVVMFFGGWLALAQLKRGAVSALIAQSLCWAGFLAVMIVAMPRISIDYSDCGLAVSAARSGANEIVCFKDYSHSFPWVLKKDVPVVAFTKSELASDGIRAPSLFWEEDYFWRRWNSNEKMAVVLREEELKDFVGQMRAPLIIDRNRRRVVVVNFS